jgi:hypothetical protein
MKTRFLITLLTALAGGAADQTAAMSDVHVLPVTMHAQANGFWCWSACGEMALTYVGGTLVPQCEIVKVHFNLTESCCGAAPLPGACLQGGWMDYKDFNAFGFTNRETAVATWQRVKSEIAHNRPLIEWNLDYHVRVIAGHGLSTGNSKKLWIVDPWPPSDEDPPGGERYWIDYSKYKDRAYKAYYRIRKK